jgi:hypothetical protein
MIETPNVQNKERLFQTAREKCQFMYNDEAIRIIDISTETLNSKNVQNDVL